MIEIYIILLGLLSAWEEINELIRDRSWDRDMFYSFLFWDSNPNSRWKNFDSKHFSFGLFALVLCIMITTCTSSVYFWLGSYILSISISTIINWWGFFYIRNLGMHILFRKNAFRQWKYLSPINF